MPAWWARSSGLWVWLAGVFINSEQWLETDWVHVLSIPGESLFSLFSFPCGTRTDDRKNKQKASKLSISTYLCQVLSQSIAFSVHKSPSGQATLLSQFHSWGKGDAESVVTLHTVTHPVARKSFNHWPLSLNPALCAIDTTLTGWSVLT